MFRLTDETLRPWLNMLAPYVAVLLFWCGLHSAWATLLAYHLQILLWSRHEVRRVLKGWNLRMFLLLALPCLATGPITFFLLPVMSRQPVQTWLAAFGLTGVALLVMIPYYGLVHPVLEQAHWGPLRGHPRLGPVAHVLFAGYHVLTVALLLRPPWIFACVGILWVTSQGWQRMAGRQQGGLLVPTLSQMLADSGMIVAVWIKASGAP